MYLEILDHEGVPVYNYLANLGESIREGVSLLKGNYFLRLKDGYDDAFSDLPYTFGVFEYNIDTCEWNDNFENAKQIEIGSTICGNIYPIKDLDYYTFLLTDSQTISINIDSVSSKIDMYVELYNAEKVLVNSKLGLVGSSLEMTHNATAGRYYLMLKDGYNSAHSEKLYYLKVQ